MKNWRSLFFSSFRERLRLPAYLNGTTRRIATGLAARLSPRERWFVTLAGGALAVTLLSLFVIAPLLDLRGRLQAKVTAKERELAEVATLATTYETLRRELEVVGSPSGTTLSPFAFLEGLTTSTIGRDKLAAINPVGREERSGVPQETIELKLSGVSLQELVDLLYKIDATGAAVRCTNLAIKKRYKDPYTFDVTLTAIALNTR
jgi:general secretion pathway protein M